MNKKRIDKLAEAVSNEDIAQIATEKLLQSGSLVMSDDITYQKIPKVKPKTFEEITNTSVINLPKNQVKPVNGRIFAIAQDPGEMKTEGGILLPTAYSLPEARKGKKREILRYFVVDVADNCNINVPAENLQFAKFRKLERGDEIFPFIPQEAEEWSFPIVHDFYNNNDYIVFHETELAGVGMSPLLKKE